MATEDKIILKTILRDLIIETVRVFWEVCPSEPKLSYKYTTGIHFKSDEYNPDGSEKDESYVETIIAEYKLKKEAQKGHNDIVKYFKIHNWNYDWNYNL